MVQRWSGSCVAEPGNTACWSGEFADRKEGAGGGQRALASVLPSAEICVFVLTHATTTVISCNESHVPVKFLYQQLSAISKFARPISFSTP